MKIIYTCHLVQMLKSAYVAACLGLKLANKLKSKAAKSRIFSRMNKIRAELKRYEKDFSIASSVAYSGVLVSLIK